MGVVLAGGNSSVDVILAGYNLDYALIAAMRSAFPEVDSLTPETISAAYARISRDPRPVDELRDIARGEVEKARRSNRRIVFDMGHSSIAEHVVFNVDTIGVSRFIVEEIEKFRLCSYTEKSQRYIRLDGDFVVPEEIESAGLKDLFVDTIENQNRLYRELYERLRAHVFDTHREMAEVTSHRSTLEGWAKEDARYVISLATETQLGMTLNARNVELMLRRCASHPLEEVRRYGTRLYEATKPVAPSLVRYTDATPFDESTRNDLRKMVSDMMKDDKGENGAASTQLTDDNVTLVAATPDGDDAVIAALLHSSSRRSMADCRAMAARMSLDQKRDVITTACRHMRSYDPPLREFEHADLCFEIIVSASCFAQLKRHRMATLSGQEYDPVLGVTIPPAITEIGMDQRFLATVEQTEDAYKRIKDKAPFAAGYVLTNAHRKRVAMKMNARELYHISRLREDVHAQWDIRQTATRMVRLGKQVMPLTLMLATGKDNFDRQRAHAFPPE
jgi:flavin-dependent thymidylate synthase